MLESITIYTDVVEGEGRTFSHLHLVECTICHCLVRRDVHPKHLQWHANVR